VQAHYGIYRTPFTWPPVRDGAVTLTAAQMRLLVSGLDWTQLGVRAMPMPAE
jgi:transposase